MIKIQSLNQNKQFLNILTKNKLNNDYFTIYFGKNNYGVCKKKNNLNISFVMKKKIINLRHAYIIFGKTSAYSEKFPIIYNEISNVFKKIKNLNS